MKIYKVIYTCIDFLRHILLCSPTILIINRKLSLDVKQLGSILYILFGKYVQKFTYLYQDL